MEFGFDLETRLTDNCVIFHGNGCDYIVRQQTEKVFRIPFETRPRRTGRVENRQSPPPRADSR